MSIKTGDVVVLKSGGPPMTVFDVSAEVVECHWFDADNELRQGKLNERELRLVASQSPAP